MIILLVSLLLVAAPAHALHTVNFQGTTGFCLSSPECNDLGLGITPDTSFTGQLIYEDFDYFADADKPAAIVHEFSFSFPGLDLMAEDPNLFVKRYDGRDEQIVVAGAIAGGSIFFNLLSTETPARFIPGSTRPDLINVQGIVWDCSAWQFCGLAVTDVVPLDRFRIPFTQTAAVAYASNGEIAVTEVAATPVPEPTTVMYVLLGMLVILWRANWQPR